MSERESEATRLQIVATNRQVEERVLRMLDTFEAAGIADPVWLATGRTGIEQGFAAINRAILKPPRTILPEDLADAG